MLDRSIPFYNAILKCSRWEPAAVRLGDGLRIRTYRPGDEEAWARLEWEIGDFASVEEALAYFSQTYLQVGPDFRDRIFFAVEAGETVGSVIAWRDRRGRDTVASLHWLVVAPFRQGRGIGKALLQTAMNWYLEAGELPVYIHTQPWSHRAIRLYAGQGFRMQKTDTFSHYENQYGKVVETLKSLLPAEEWLSLPAEE